MDSLCLQPTCPFCFCFVFDLKKKLCNFYFVFIVCGEFEQLLEDQAPLQSYVEWMDNMVDRCVVQVYVLYHSLYNVYLISLSKILNWLTPNHLSIEASQEVSRHGAADSAPVPAHVVLFWNQDYPGYDSPQRPELWLDLFYLVQPKEIILIISTSFDKVHSSRDFISHKKN